MTAGRMGENLAKALAPRRRRDVQRSRVYAWERRFFADDADRRGGGMPMDECEAMIRRVWRCERGRYGLARRPAPAVFTGRGGGMAARAGHWIRLGVWARQPRVILHEVAHCLNPYGAHDARFVGILIGLFSRHMGRDRDALVTLADDFGVRYDSRSIGATPEFGWHRRAENALLRLGGRVDNVVELAGEMGCGYRRAWAAVLTLIRVGRVRRRGKRLMLVEVEGVAS